MTCKQPDRECPKLVCGYPLPCPWHTVVIDTVREPPTVTIPITAEAAWKDRDKLVQIGKAMMAEPGSTSTRVDVSPDDPSQPKTRKLDPEEN